VSERERERKRGERRDVGERGESKMHINIIIIIIKKGKNRLGVSVYERFIR